MARISGGRLVAKALKAEGVKYVFSIPGGHISPIYEGLMDEGIEIIGMRHEQGAGNAADGWARVTRTPGVCLVTAGPGLANLLPALIQAQSAGSPVVAITGHTPFVFSDKEAFQEIDSVGITAPIVKWARLCAFPHRIPEYVQMAFRHAMSGRWGPVLLAFPLDTVCMECDEERVAILPPERYRATSPVYGDPVLVKKAVQMLIEAERPLMIIGSGAYWSGAWNEVVQLAEFLKIPVAYTEMGMGCIPDEHPLCVGNVIGNPLTSRADVILAVGVVFGELLGFGTEERMYARDVKVIHVDIDPTVVGKNRPIDIGIIGDPKAVLSQMLEAAREVLGPEGVKERNWINVASNTRKALVSAFEAQAEDTSKPIKPQKLMKEIREFLTKDTIAILDGGDTTVWAYIYLRAKAPGQIIGSQANLGYLGAGVPMGIGAKLAHPDKTVFVITGDGSFLFNGVELETAARHEIPIIVIIVNDSAWGMVYHQNVLTWKDKRKAAVGTRLGEKVRYDKFAESLGCYGEMVTDPSEIKPAIKRAIESGMPAVIDVRIDPEAINLLDQYFATTVDPNLWRKHWSF